MQEFHNLDVPKLLEMLHDYNEEYAILMVKGTQVDFDICRYKIIQIQQELNTRKQTKK